MEPPSDGDWWPLTITWSNTTAQSAPVASHLKHELCHRRTARTTAPEKPSDVQTKAAYESFAIVAYFFATLVCEDHPALATRSQNILLDGMHFASFPLGVAGAKTWNRQFRTSAT
jgi:hypothetical protein